MPTRASDIEIIGKKLKINIPSILKEIKMRLKKRTSNNTHLQGCFIEESSINFGAETISKINDSTQWIGLT